MYECVGIFTFVFAPLGPLGLITVRHFPKKCSNAAMPQSGENTDVGALLFFLDPRDDQAESRGNKCNESTYQENTQGGFLIVRKK